ncbi:hypothetical protein LAZ67_3003730 [Cordylochernes scorpioides]|uniref:Integrase catalytic domain-containing protein n=1 Tax=Cordylochernes scorpioides TaxID=51811 RepID=A0ABY6KA49_9ARAC|nr:hypothetical protein LAZ67_3003730 [Cordylochernes scorpioides]
MTTELPQIQKFNGDNFHLWKFQMKIILEAKDLLSITDGSEVKPEIEDIAKFSNWKKKDAKSKMLITTALEFKYLQQIVNCQTSAEMWKKLSTIYELKSETNKYLLQQRFFEYKMNPNDNIATHISKVETLAQQMKDLGEPISDVALITKIICSLPDKYKDFITAWDSVSSKEKTLENLTARLLKEESLQDHWDSSGNFKPDNALVTFSKFNRYSTASNKQQQHQQSIKDKKKNTHCGYCKKKGHWWKECYKRKEEQKGQQPSSSSRDDSCAFSAETSAFLAETKDSWIADSGATDHMTFRREWFSTFEEIPEGVHPVCLGNGKKIYAKGKGNIDILSYVDSQKINATLLDVLYIPELETNLFSISTATKHGLTLICKGNQIKLTKNSKVLVTGIKDNSNLYRIFIKAKQSSQTHVAQLSLDIWHQRMGHVNPIKLTQMFENNVFEDDIKIREKPDSLLCEACIYGKQNRKVFHASTSPNSTYPGELIYSDVGGPMSKRSPGGSLYFVSFKDDFSRFRVAYFIRHKSDVLEKFKEFVKRVRTETGNKIKRFRTDNGTEFLNKNFSDYLKSLGIVHELTAPYTPEQNGIAERDNRTIVESAKCMLHGRKMPLELWAEAVNTAVYLLNRCTTKVLGNSTPYEIWYKRKPSILHLKTFGCNAYVHIPKDNRKKLDKKSIRTFFVGYTETNKNYRMWDPIARKIIISRDVIFTEANTSENIQDNQQEQVTIYSEESVDNTNTSSKPEESCRYPLRNRIRENEQTSTSCTRAISYACYVHDQEPLNYEDAIVGQNSKQWKLAMDDEFNSLMKNQTWTYVTLPSDRKAIACKWVYKIKQNADGSNKMFKARLVAKGYSQKPGLDYGETFSPVVKFDSIRTILSLCASLDMEMIQLDVKSAFLNGDLEEELYMEQPQGYENPDFPNHVCSLQKSIYGLKQSPRMWNKKFHEFLIKFDLKPSISDSCVYTMKCKQAYILLAIYVDDCLICSVNKQHLDDIVQYLNSNFEIKTFTADYFLGLQIYRDRTTKMLFLHQASYIERTLEHYNLLEIKLQSVPSDPYSKLTKEMCPKDDQEIEEMNNIPYRQTIGSLMYLMTGTRPDIAYAVSRVSQFMNNPGPSHWTAVKKIFGYLKATKNIGICFGGSSCTSTLIGFSDADFAGDLDTRKSTTGYVFMLNNGPISWCSQKQNCVSLSTTESEYIAASKATKEAIWLRQLLRELHQEQVKPTTIFCDNQSCIRLVHNPEYHKRTKHIDISYHFIRDHFQNHAIDLLYVCSNDQAADIFTKALPPERYRRLRSQLGLFETTECTLDTNSIKTSHCVVHTTAWTFKSVSSLYGSRGGHPVVAWKIMLEQNSNWGRHFHGWPPVLSANWMSRGSVKAVDKLTTVGQLKLPNDVSWNLLSHHRVTRLNPNITPVRFSFKWTPANCALSALLPALDQLHLFHCCMVGQITWHLLLYSTQFFLKKIQAVQDSTCFCGLGEQTSIHLLLECPVFRDYRVNKMEAFLLGKSKPAPKDKESAPKKESAVPWVEKYRPRTVDDVAYQDEVVAVLKKTLEGSDFPNLLFYGPPGTGKTSTILALAREMFGDLFKSRILELNASDERGIQVIRDKVKTFAQQTVQASAQTNKGKRCPAIKIVILDEADSMTHNAQAALRRTMEKHSKTTRFCLICNYISRIIEPLTSRCSKFRFKSLSTSTLLGRLQYVCSQENIVCQPPVLQRLIDVSEGDLRKAINLLQSAHRLKVGQEIQPEDLDDIAGVVPKQWVQDFQDTCQSNSYKALERFIRDLIAEGYSASQLISQLHDHLIDSSLSDQQKAAVCEKLAICEHRLLDGADEFLQMLDLGCNLMRQLCVATQ